MEIFDIKEVLIATGYVGLAAIVYAESGLLVGMFLPGDSLLFTAGFLASQGLFNIAAIVLIVCIAAILGDSTGYSLGRKFGPRIFKKEKSRLFDPAYVDKAEDFYKDHGRKALILARFTPIIRTLAPVLAGVGKMEYRTFVSFNVIGGILWGAGLPLLGYFLGNAIPDIDHYLLPIVAGIIIVSLLPSVIHYLKMRRER